MQLYNYRNKIIRLSENKNIKPSMHTLDAKSDGVEESEQIFDESMRKRVKSRGQKSDRIIKMITEKDKIKYSENIFNFRVYLICKKLYLKHRMHKEIKN